MKFSDAPNTLNCRDEPAYLSACKQYRIFEAGNAWYAHSFNAVQQGTKWELIDGPLPSREEAMKACQDKAGSVKPKRRKQDALNDKMHECIVSRAARTIR